MSNIKPIEHEWRTGRCACCYKKTEIVIGPYCNETARGWDNVMSRERASSLAAVGTCPWCGRSTTIVARILVRRFEPALARYERALF